MTEKLTCRVCSEPLSAPETGRPPSYCSTSCRRAAEAERARLGRHISWLMRERVKLRGQLAAAGLMTGGRDKQLEVYDAELADARRQLADLRGDTDE